MSRVNLFPLELYGIDSLRSIHLPDEQNRHVHFAIKSVPYEAAGNPWVFAIDLDGECVGYLSAEKDFEGDLHIHKFVIKPEAQNRGLGSDALNEFITLARNSGASVIFLSVAYENVGAERFYRRFGFRVSAIGTVETGCRSFYLPL